MEKLNFVKEYKDLYMPKCASIIDVPPMKFIAVTGKGNPNTCDEYKTAVEILYGLSYSIKMSKMSGSQPDGYFEYVVPPLEGLWWGEDGYFDGLNITDKDKFYWKSMIRQPDFVTEDVFLRAKEILARKKPELDLSKAEFFQFSEGLCAQIMHKGAFDDEPKSVIKLKEFIAESGYKEDMEGERKHHEIYLSDPRRCAVENLKTIIRHPIIKL